MNWQFLLNALGAAHEGQSDDPRVVLVQTRVVWLALLLGIVCFGSITVFMSGAFDGASAGDSRADVAGTDLFAPERLVGWIACGLLAVFVPIGLFARGQAFKRGWVGDVVTPRAFFGGNVVLWALIEGPTLMAYVSILLSGYLLPGLAVGCVGVLMMLLTFPRGAALFERGESIGERKNPYRYEP